MCPSVRAARSDQVLRRVVVVDIVGDRHQIIFDSLLFNILTTLGWDCCWTLGLGLGHHTVVVGRTYGIIDEDDMAADGFLLVCGR